MYGTIFRMRPKGGKEQEITRLMEEWDRERRPKVKGAIGSYMFRLDKGGLMGVAMFDNRENYMANAQDPEQDAWYRRLRDLLEADPEWNDGEVIYTASRVATGTR